MAQTHAFELTLPGGTRVDAYDRYDVASDMFGPGAEWTFSLWQTDATEGAFRALRRAAKLGDTILFAIDGAPQLNGPIERDRLRVTRDGGVALVLSGRDAAATALDWDADPRVSLRGATLEHVLSELFNRVGISVVVGAGADAAREVQTRARPGARGAAATRQARRQRVDLAHARPGEKVWQVAESIVRRLGYLMWVAPNAELGMSLVVDVPAYDQAPLFRFERRRVRTGEVTPHDILDSDFVRDIRHVPTHVYVAGHAPQGDAREARHRVLHENAELARFPEVRNPLPPHPRWIRSRRARDPAAATQEARRVMADAMTNWRGYTCTVQGHGQVVDGRARLYAVNTMAHVKDPRSGLDEEMLITRVEFAGSRREGQTTRLTLGTKGAIQLTPEAA